MTKQPSTVRLNRPGDTEVAEDPELRLAYLGAVVEASNDAIVSKALDGTITSWNASAERIFGYRSEEILGKNIRTLIPADLQDEEAEILARIRAGDYIEHYETVRLAKVGLKLETILPSQRMKAEADEAKVELEALKLRNMTVCTLASLSRLAENVFQTSLTSTVRRYVGLDWEACSMIVSHDGVVK